MKLKRDEFRAQKVREKDLASLKYLVRAQKSCVLSHSSTGWDSPNRALFCMHDIHVFSPNKPRIRSSCI